MKMMKMKKFALIILPILTALAVASGVNDANATPSTTYFTPATSDIQPYGVLHLGVDNYFTVRRKNERGAFATDLGLEIGVLPFEKFQMEVGIDYNEPATDPVFFNAKLGTPEDTIFKGSPALNLGIFNVGTDRRTKDNEIGTTRTDFNIVHVMAGKTLPFSLGRVHGGVYHGNSKTLVNVNKPGNNANTGWMAGYDKGFKQTKDKDGNEYSKWMFAADWASGKNAIGGGGFGMYHFFTKDISLLTGPVWLIDPGTASPNPNAKWVWTVQLDINY